MKRRPFVDYALFKGWGDISFKKWKEILFIGVPIGISIFVETSIFSAVTLLMSNYSTAVISAHQIALNFTSLLYMIPLSISMGATILVGQAVGAGQMSDAKQYSYLSVGLALAVQFCLNYDSASFQGTNRFTLYDGLEYRKIGNTVLYLRCIVPII